MSLLELQVQVQTRFGLSRSAKASFPACQGDCQNGGSYGWSKDRVNTECVCLQGYYGSQCQKRSCLALGGECNQATSYPPKNLLFLLAFGEMVLIRVVCMCVGGRAVGARNRICVK